MDGIGIIVIISIVFFVGYRILVYIDKSNQERWTKVERLSNYFNDQKVMFEETLSGFFKKVYCPYQNAYSSLIQYVSNMEEINREMRSLSKKDDGSNIISLYSKLAEEFNFFGQRVKSLPYTCMMDSENYGKIQRSYWDSIRSMNKNAADTIIANCKKSISSHDYT